MYIVLVMVFFAIWCLGTAWRVQRELSSRPRPEPDCALPPARHPPQRSDQAPPPTAAPPQRPVSRPRAPSERPPKAASSGRGRGEVLVDPESETQPSLLPGSSGERSPVAVRILRRELGGGTTLAAVARWDGFCVSWELVDLSPEWQREIQRLVVQETGLWPGHGLRYLRGLVATLDDGEGGSRWEARWEQRGAA